VPPGPGSLISRWMQGAPLLSGIPLTGCNGTVVDYGNFFIQGERL
jgi:hypothetical protein